MSIHNEAPAPSSRRIKELEVMVADVIVETSDASTLVLFTGNDRREPSRSARIKRESYG